jgi:hypothetical protein
VRAPGPRTWEAALLGLLLFALVMLAVHNLGYPGIWYDEAAQIWVSQGLHQYSEVHERLKGWRDVMRMNRFGNLDPGGYSLLLHAWAWIDRGLVWFRLFPFLFFLLTVAVLARHAWELTGSRAAALVSGFMPLAFTQVLYFAFEIRAYSMEVAGVVAVGYVLHRAVRAPSLGNHVALGVVCAVFLGSRYSFVVVVLAAVLALVSVRVWRLGRLRDEIENLAGLLVPILNSGAMIYRFTLRHHLAGGLGATAGSPGAIQAPQYVKAWVLRGQPPATAAAVLWENLASPAALPVTLAVAGLAVWPLARRWPWMQRWPGACSFPAVAIMALLAQLISAALSARGAYPWHFGQKWSLYLHGISMLCLLYLGAAAWWSARRWRRAPLLAVAVLLVAAFLAVQAATYRRTHWADLAPALERLETMSPASGSVLVTHYEIPTVRYLYELGPFRGDGRYPAVFRFERRAEWDARSPIDARAECLDYVVSPAPLGVLAARIPGVRLTRVPGPIPPYLIAIDPALPRPPHCPERRDPGPTR